MSQLFLALRIVCYVSIIILGTKVYLSKGSKVDLVLAAMAAVGLLTDALDFTVITSNLEISALANLLFTYGIFLMIYIDSGNVILAFSGPLIVSFFTALGFVTDYDLGWIATNPVYYSDYNWLNTNQAANLSLIRGLVLVVGIYYWLWVIVKKHHRASIIQQNHVIYAFAFLALFGCRFVYESLHRFLFSAIHEYHTYTYPVLVGIFLVSHIMILLGLKWKISS